MRRPAREGPRELAPLPAPASALAWYAAGDAVALASGLSLYRLPLDGAAPTLIATIRDDANDTIVRLDARVDGVGFVAMTALGSGSERFSNRRYWEIDAAGAIRETNARGADALAARRPRATTELETPVVSPSGRSELRVALPERAGLGASERLEIAEAGGAARTLLTIADLRATTPNLTGVVDDAGWAGGSETVLFVAESVCGETCSGPLFAVEPDGSNVRKLAESVEEIPREWNGTEVVFDDFPTERQLVILFDLATGERVDLGPGAGPKWAPR